MKVISQLGWEEVWSSAPLSPPPWWREVVWRRFRKRTVSEKRKASLMLSCRYTAQWWASRTFETYRNKSLTLDTIYTIHTIHPPAVEGEGCAVPAQAVAGGARRALEQARAPRAALPEPGAVCRGWIQPSCNVTSLSVRASNEPSRRLWDVLQSWRRALLRPSPGWKRLLALSHLRHY